MSCFFIYVSFSSQLLDPQSLVHPMRLNQSRTHHRWPFMTTLLSMWLECAFHDSRFLISRLSCGVSDGGSATQFVRYAWVWVWAERCIILIDSSLVPKSPAQIGIWWVNHARILRLLLSMSRKSEWVKCNEDVLHFGFFLTDRITQGSASLVGRNPAARSGSALTPQSPFKVLLIGYSRSFSLTFRY
jgi:hypothetical protein